MAYNGSGTFLINTAGQPVVANTVISATVFNALTADLATGLSTAITKDGQTTITANIPFASNKITGLGAGTLATDAAQLGQVQSTAAKLITVSGTDTITGTMSPTLTAYAAGQLFYFVAAGANTTTVTLNVDGLGAKAVTRDGSTALAAGDINSGEVVVVIYDGTRFQMINAANSFGNTTINGTLTVTGNTGLQANVSITSALSVGGVFAVTGNAGFQANVSITSALSVGGVFAVTGASTLTSASISTGNLTFSGTGQRITGDMSNATLANRLAFQTSTTNGNTRLSAIPNGTGSTTSLSLFNSSDPANASTFAFANSATEAQVAAGITGTGTYLPMTFYTGGSERARLDTSGNLGIGRAPNYQLDVYRSGTTNTTVAAANDNVVNILQVSGSTAGVVGTITSHPLILTAGNTERMRIDASTGNVGIGGTADANAKVMITGTYPVSSNSSRAIRIAGTIPSGTTDNFIGVASIQSTQAASFTLSSLFHFYAIQSTIGSGSAVTNQYGFFAQSSLTGATNNYGFYSDIASGSNRWNFYAAGTARNYMAGRLSVGTTTDDAFLHVLNGDNNVTGRIASNASTGLTTDIFQVTALNHASGTGFYFERFYSSGPTVQFAVRGDGTIYAQNTTVQSLSDARAKENVRNATEGLSVIDALRPVRFDFKHGFGNNRKNQLGFVAQEVEAIFPDAVDVMGDKDENGDPYKSVGPAALIPVLVKAIQELSAKVAALEAK